MQFADLVATSAEVAETSARSQKTASLAALLRSTEVEELPVAIGLLIGELRQGKIGVGWATVSGLDDVEPAETPSLSLSEIDQALSVLAGTSGQGSQGRRRKTMEDLYSRATAPEQWFLSRLLVGELRTGALAGVVTDAVAKAAGVPAKAVRRATMLSGDLAEVAIVARLHGEEGLAKVGLRLLRALQPMLAKTSEGVAEALDEIGQTASVEWKLDGARIQVHRQGSEVRIFTRTLRDVTAHLPDLVALAQQLPASRFVLDGEAIGLDETERPEMFQEIMSRFSREAIDDIESGREGWLQARFFDLLHLDGEDLVDRPLTERLDRLDRLVGPLRIPGVITDDPDVAAAKLEEAIENGHEGVMVKAASSAYEAGRRGGAWRKVKPVHTLDLVVLAAEWGHGRRRGWLSNLHLGARNPEAGEDTTSGERYVMVGKTFKGLTDELLKWQTARFQELAADTSGDVVMLPPEIVVEIALDGVQASTRYPGGVALRFARVRRYRPDKIPAEADTIGTVQAMLPRR